MSDVPNMMFFPYASVTRSVACLRSIDVRYVRRVSLDILHDLTHGVDLDKEQQDAFKNHPSIIYLYGMSACSRWVDLGEKDVVRKHLSRLAEKHGINNFFAYPDWFGNEEIHTSHQSALLRLDKSHYEKWFPETPDDLEVIWPLHDDRSDLNIHSGPESRSSQSH